MTNLKEIKEAADAARLQHRPLMQTGAPNRDDDAEAECKQRRLHLQFCREEFEFYKQKRDYDFELHQRERKFNIEALKKELAVEEQGFAFEQRRLA